jgi:hypothetical protein
MNGQMAGVTDASEGAGRGVRASCPAVCERAGRTRVMRIAGRAIV